MLDKCLVFMQESCVRSKFLSFSLRPAVFCRDVMCPFFIRAACKMFIICLFTVILSSLPNTPPVDEGTIFWTKDGTSIAQVDTFLYCVCIINPRRACARVTVVALFVCLSVCLSVCYRSSCFSVRLYLKPTILRGLS